MFDLLLYYMRLNFFYFRGIVLLKDVSVRPSYSLKIFGSLSLCPLNIYVSILCIRPTNVLLLNTGVEVYT
jgi:hypothetical protein